MMNKRILFVLPLLLLSISGFAQLLKGNKILGGTLNYSTSTITSDTDVGAGENRNTNSFTNNANLGFFVSDRTVVGLAIIIYNHVSEVSNSSSVLSRFESDNFGFGPFVRRYFPVKEWVAFYGQAELGYIIGNVNQTYNNPTLSNLNYDQDSKAFNISTSLGLAFFPTNWMSIDLAVNPLSYSNQITQTEQGSSSSETKTNNFNFNLNTQSFFIGAHFFFNKK